MKKPIPQYTFFKTKYGSELLIDVVDLKYVKRFLNENPIHTLTYYDITFITEGEGGFSIDNQSYEATPGDVFFSRPGEVRHWDTTHIVNGFALIFEDSFLSSVFKDPLFVQHLSFFSVSKSSSNLHLSEELYVHILQLLKNIKIEIDAYLQNDVHVLRALLYEILMLLDRAFQKMVSMDNMNKGNGNMYIARFMELVNIHLKEQHTVSFYADKLCITPNYLNEITNMVLNTNAKQYIQDKIMDEAKRLLLYSNSSIAEIAFELNFSTVAYFVRLFRKCIGSTPLVYRKEHKP